MAEFIHNVPMVALNELTGQCGIPYVCADEEQAAESPLSISYPKGAGTCCLWGSSPNVWPTATGPPVFWRQPGQSGFRPRYTSAIWISDQL